MKNILARNAAFNVAYRVLNVVFPLISASYISRVLGPDGIGKVAYAQNIVSYFVMFAALGIPSYGTREIARCKDDPRESNRLFSELVIINLISSLVCIAAYYGFVFTAFAGNTLLYGVFGLELFLNCINIDWLYQGREEYVYITMRSILVKILSLLALFLFVKGPGDYVIYGLIVCLGTGCNHLFNVYHARKMIRLVWRGLKLGRHMGPIMVLLASSAMASLYNKVDTTMLGWLSTDEAVGFYSNSHKMVSVILTLVTAISAVFLPRLSYVYRNDRENYQRYLTLGLKIVLILALPCCCGLLVVADEMSVVMFGSSFLPMASTMRILAVLILIRGVGDLLCYQAIISSGHERHLVWSRVAAGVANVVLNALLIPRFAECGAALASVISELIVNGMLLPYSMKNTRVTVSRRFAGSIAAGTAAMMLAAWMVSARIESDVLSLMLAVTVGAVSYFAVALALKNDMITEAAVMLKEKLGLRAR